MTEPLRCPAPIVAAIVLSLAFATISTAVVALPGDIVWPILLGLVGFWGFVAYGTWRGWVAAQMLGALAGALGVVSGVRDVPSSPVGVIRLVADAALVVLLVGPKSARDWFNYKH